MFEAPTAPALPHGWRDVVLGDLGEFSTSSVDKKVNTAELPVRLVNYMDVYRSPYLTSQFDYMQVTASQPEIAKSQVLAGDLLFTPSSETPDDVGHSAVVVEALPDTLHSYHTVRLRIAASEAIDLRFRGRFANSSLVLKHFEKCATGSTRYTLSLADFRSAPVRIPPIAEQAKIAQILDTLDTTIRHTEAIIVKLKQVKQGLLHDLLTRGIDANGELRPPQREAPHLYKASPLGWIPVEWNVVATANRCSLITKGTTPANTHMWQGEEGVRFLRVDNLTFDGQLSFAASNFRISDATHEGELLRSQCLPGDVLTNIVGPPLGKLGLITEESGPININQAIALFRPTPDLLSHFLLTWLGSTQAQVWLRQRAKQTSGQVNLTLAVCQELPIPDMSLVEQCAIVERIASSQVQIDAEASTLQKLEQLKSGLMDDLLTGRVRVTPLLQDHGQSS